MFGRLFGPERRSPQFTERLSWFMALVAAFGGIYVILDPVITFDVSWGSVKIGGEGFSEQLKGAVVAMILIEGWKAVKEYWLGSSAGGEKKADTVSRIAEAAPAAAAALAANTNGQEAPKVAENVVVAAEHVNVTEEKKP